MPETWKPPMITAMPAARNGLAICSERGYWFDCTPTRPTKPKLPLARISAMMRSTRTRVLVSSMATMSMSMSGPSTWRCAQSSTRPYTVASEFAGIGERNQRMT